MYNQRKLKVWNFKSYSSQNIWMVKTTIYSFQQFYFDNILNKNIKLISVYEYQKPR